MVGSLLSGFWHDTALVSELLWPRADGMIQKSHITIFAIEIRSMIGIFILAGDFLSLAPFTPPSYCSKKEAFDEIHLKHRPPSKLATIFGRMRKHLEMILVIHDMLSDPRNSWFPVQPHVPRI
jgi:hypothetical protein